MFLRPLIPVVLFLFLLIPSIFSQQSPPPLSQPPTAPNATIGQQLSRLFKRPFRPATCSPAEIGPDQRCALQSPPRAEGCLGAPRELQGRYSNAVDNFVTSLNANSHGRLQQTFISDFDEEFIKVPGMIADKIMEISGGGQFCNISMVAQTMRDHPLMNFKFWLRAFHRIVLTQPALGHNLEEDPLAELEADFEFQPPAWFSPRPAALPPLTSDGSEAACPGQRGSSSDPNEDIFWYFREDVGINRYHGTWHDDNPPESTRDRRGELFFYFHRNILARYNTERVTHSIPAATDLRFANGIIVDPGYTPNLSGVGASGAAFDYMPRLPSRRIPEHVTGRSRSDFPDFLSKIQNVERDISIYTGHFSRDKVHSADELGHLVESTSRSHNHPKYGSIHNVGHMVLGSLVRLEQAVVSDLPTALRDPVFYQWHGYVDAIMEKHKHQLPPHPVGGVFNEVGGVFPLSFPDIRVDNVFVATATAVGPQNVLHTFWKNRVYDGRQCRKTLDHEDFTWNFKIANLDSKRTQKKATVRIFLAPTKGYNGAPLSLDQQQEYAFILEIFNINLNPGDNSFSRSSNSWLSTTGPRWNDPILQRNKRLAPHQDIVFTGCGHPHNLLLPMGNDCSGGNGEEFDMFTIVTDESIYPFNHRVEDPNISLSISPPVLCGVSGKKYSDEVLPMGYPFDGRSLAGFGNSGNFAGEVPNIAVTKINILHHDALLSEGMTWNMLRPGKPSTNPRCPGPGPRPTPGPCWCDYNNVKHCEPVPYGYICEIIQGCNYCRPATPYLGPCWFDFFGARHCGPTPVDSTCVGYGFLGLRYCHVCGCGDMLYPTTPRPPYYGNYNPGQGYPMTPTQGYNYGPG